MSISKETKQQVVSEVMEDLKKAKSVIVTDYRGLDVSQLTMLRRSLFAEKVKYVVIKNTLAKIAARELGLEALYTYLEGPTAIAFGFDDPSIPAKLLNKFAKEFNELEIRGGLLEGSLIDAAQVVMIADLPSRDVLLSQVVGAIASPMTNFAGGLQGVLRKFVYTLDAVREKKVAAG